MLGSSPLAGLTPAATGAATATPTAPVAPRTARTATPERPPTSAAFEQADTLVLTA